MKGQFSAAVAAAVAAVIIPAAAVHAHHSFAAEFDANKPVSVTGTITKMDWVNPHSWLYIDVKDASGKVVAWKFEFGSPNSLYRRGWWQKDLPVGATVQISGFLAKDGSPTANANDVILADGRKLFAGSSGTGAPYERGSGN